MLDALRGSDSLVRWAELAHAARGPWTPELSRLVAERLRARERRRHDYRGYRELCEVAATHMSPEHLTELQEDPSFDDASTEAYLRLRDTLRFRLDMHREL
uniref:DUF5691 domain-containing protein n=1 Tax=Nocardiopsis halotolerans TaxID=124252 RepID=UPI001F4D1785|nr:hypothetical protein [Nocardiopsis halotolerans]